MPDINNLVFVGLNSHVAALDRNTGETVWEWRAPKPISRGYVSLLVLDAQHLIVSINGYSYCLDPLCGQARWFNELAGFGSGVASIAALGKHNAQDALLGAVSTDESRRANSS
jgi:hypothetical protein